MKYLLLNRNNIVVDILDNIRYTKLQPSSGIVIACDKKEGTGVIGSDANTLYTLIQSDTKNDENAVYVLPLEKVPSMVIANKTILNPKTNEFEPRYVLSEIQSMKQEENKVAFEKYLVSHPLTWVDGKKYGITEQDQIEINLRLNQYQNTLQAGKETPALEWHARHEESKPWTFNNLTALNLAISKAVYPKYHLMQQYKTRIYNSETAEEVEAIILNYEDET